MPSSSKDRQEKTAVAKEERPERSEPWWEFCPICGSKLMNQKCRLICPDKMCGYFQSCSEFDT